jgi:hypothetical protein
VASRPLLLFFLETGDKSEQRALASEPCRSLPVHENSTTGWGNEEEAEQKTKIGGKKKEQKNKFTANPLFFYNS